MCNKYHQYQECLEISFPTPEKVASKQVFFLSEASTYVPYHYKGYVQTHAIQSLTLQNVMLWCIIFVHFWQDAKVDAMVTYTSRFN